MHMVIRVLVYARDHEEALSSAQAVAERLVERGTFDYFVNFKEEGLGLFGQDRWGVRPFALPVHTDRHRWYIMAGLDDVMAAFDATRREFFDDLAKIKYMIEKYPAEDLFEERSSIDPDPDDRRDRICMFKHYCHCAGQYEGSNVWLYDDTASGIRDSDHLRRVFEDWDEPEDCQLFVVPFDVHF